MELKDVLGKLGRLDANELNATGQKHIELGECLVKLAETLQTLETIELPAGLGLEVKPALPEPQYWPVESKKIGRPKRGEKRPLSKRRKNLRREIIALLEFQGVETLSVAYVAQRLDAREQAVRAAINFGKGEPAAYIDGQFVVIGERPAKDETQQQAKPPKQPKTVASANATNSEKKWGKFDQDAYSEAEHGEFDEVLADQIHRLLTDEGSMPVPAIAARLRVEAARVGECCRSCEWFSKTTAGDIQVAMV